jgi:hypothetical protein
MLRLQAMVGLDAAGVQAHSGSPPVRRPIARPCCECVTALHQGAHPGVPDACRLHSPLQRTASSASWTPSSLADVPGPRHNCSHYYVVRGPLESTTRASRNPQMSSQPDEGRRGPHKTGRGGLIRAARVRALYPCCREPSGLLPTRRWSPRTGLTLRSRRSQRRHGVRGHRRWTCHKRAIHTGLVRSRADNHGQQRSRLDLRRSPPSQVAAAAELALGAGGRRFNPAVPTTSMSPWVTNLPGSFRPR